MNSLPPDVDPSKPPRAVPADAREFLFDSEEDAEAWATAPQADSSGVFEKVAAEFTLPLAGDCDFYEPEGPVDGGRNRMIERRKNAWKNARWDAPIELEGQIKVWGPRLRIVRPAIVRRAARRPRRSSAVRRAPPTARAADSPEPEPPGSAPPAGGAL